MEVYVVLNPDGVPIPVTTALSPEVAWLGGALHVEKRANADRLGPAIERMKKLGYGMGVATLAVHDVLP